MTYEIIFNLNICFTGITAKNKCLHTYHAITAYGSAASNLFPSPAASYNALIVDYKTKITSINTNTVKWDQRSTLKA